MMLFSGLRTRSAKRDRETERVRIERLSQMIAKLGAEIENERAGLERRRAETKTSAAFAQAALENEGDATITGKVDDLTSSMLRYETRIEALGKQEKFVNSLSKYVADFPASISKVIDEEAQ